MNTFLKILILLTFVSCNGQDKKDNLKNSTTTNTIESLHLDSVKTKKIISLKEFRLAKDSLKPYSVVKKEVGNVLVSLNKKDIVKDTLSHIFSTLLLHRIIPYWENTTWSFNGYTGSFKISTPKIHLKQLTTLVFVNIL